MKCGFVLFVYSNDCICKIGKKRITENIFYLLGGKHQHLRRSLTLATAEVAKVGRVRHRVCLKETDSCTPQSAAS